MKPPEKVVSALFRPKMSVLAVELFVTVPAPESWLIASSKAFRSRVAPAARVKVEKSGMTLLAPRKSTPALRAVAPV